MGGGGEAYVGLFDYLLLQEGGFSQAGGICSFQTRLRLCCDPLLVFAWTKNWGIGYPHGTFFATIFGATSCDNDNNYISSIVYSHYFWQSENSASVTSISTYFMSSLIKVGFLMDRLALNFSFHSEYTAFLSDWLFFKILLKQKSSSNSSGRHLGIYKSNDPYVFLPSTNFPCGGCRRLFFFRRR